FFDYMQELVKRHGGFDMKLRVTGDLDVDQHHTVEDVGIALGEAVSAALGNLQSELVGDFFDGFAQGARANVHVKVLYGRSSHHQIEALFKAFARALRYACSKDKRLARVLPSTKGLL